VVRVGVGYKEMRVLSCGSKVVLDAVWIWVDLKLVLNALSPCYFPAVMIVCVDREEALQVKQSL